jgi:hypothetical protein
MGGQLRQAEPATKGDGGTDEAGGLKLLSAAGDGMKRGRAGVDKVDKGESLLRTGRGRGRHRRQLHRKKGWWLERTEMARARGLQRTASRLDRVGQGVGLRRPPAALVLGAIRLVRPSLPCRQDRRQARSSRRARRTAALLLPELERTWRGAGLDKSAAVWQLRALPFCRVRRADDGATSPATTTTTHSKSAERGSLLPACLITQGAAYQLHPDRTTLDRSSLESPSQTSCRTLRSRRNDSDWTESAVLRFPRRRCSTPYLHRSATA